MASFLVDDDMMRGGLELKGCDLLLFAVVESFTKKGLTMFESEVSLSRHFPYSRRQIGKGLQNLVEKGLIMRSASKHCGQQSFDYCVNCERVRTIIPSWCEKSSQQGVKFCLSRTGTNITEGCEQTSHNNITDNQTEKGSDKIPVRAPFPYMTLNRKWRVLLEQPRWKDKTPAALEIAVGRLRSVSPPIAIEMMNYTISNGYGDIYAPKKEMVETGNIIAEKFLEEEKQLRLPKIRLMLERLAEIAPKELLPYLPTEKQCSIKFGEFNIKCPSAVMDWIEGNNEKTFPIIRQATAGLKLMYDDTK